MMPCASIAAPAAAAAATARKMYQNRESSMMGFVDRA
jgi:hypothetical protein